MQETEEKDLQSKLETIKYQVIGLYMYINNYLKVKWIKCASEKTQNSWMETKQDLHIRCLQEINLRPRDTYRLKVRSREKYSMQTESRRRLEQQYQYQNFLKTLKLLEETRKDTT